MIIKSLFRIQTAYAFKIYPFYQRFHALFEMITVYIYRADNVHYHNEIKRRERSITGKCME